MRKVKKHELAEDYSINMTPMIDVVFQLILFFMLTSSLTHPRQIELDLPESASATKPQSEQAMIVSYRIQNGKPDLRLNGKAIAKLDQLGQAMRAIADPAQKPAVDVQIDRTVQYQNVIRVMDAVRSAGYAKFSLDTIAPGGSNSQ